MSETIHSNSAQFTYTISRVTVFIPNSDGIEYTMIQQQTTVGKKKTESQRNDYKIMMLYMRRKSKNIETTLPK